MLYMKIRFTEWRDAPQITARAPAMTEIAAAEAKLAELDARVAELNADVAHAQGLLKIADGTPLRERLAGHVSEIDNVFVARKAALAALEAAGNASVAAMKSHAKVGSLGYLVIDAETMTAMAVVDEAGAALTEGAVYGYEIADSKPPAPDWADAFEAAIAAEKKRLADIAIEKELA